MLTNFTTIQKRIFYMKELERMEASTDIAALSKRERLSIRRELTKLQQTLGLTVYMVTHDLDTIFTVCDRVAVLADKMIVRTGSPAELQRHPNHPWIKEYFCGERARAATPGERPRIPA